MSRTRRRYADPNARYGKRYFKQPPAARYQRQDDWLRAEEEATGYRISGKSHVVPQPYDDRLKSSLPPKRDIN